MVFQIDLQYWLPSWLDYLHESNWLLLHKLHPTLVPSPPSPLLSAIYNILKIFKNIECIIKSNVPNHIPSLFLYSNLTGYILSLDHIFLSTTRWKLSEVFGSQFDNLGVIHSSRCSNYHSIWLQFIILHHSNTMESMHQIICMKATNAHKPCSEFWCNQRDHCEWWISKYTNSYIFPF